LADVLRADAPRGLGLALEALERVALLRHALVQGLDRDLAADADVLALVDGAHRPLPEQAHDAVLFAVYLADCEIHLPGSAQYHGRGPAPHRLPSPLPSG